MADFKLKFSEENYKMSFSAAVKVEQYTNADPYIGDYEVTPRVRDQTLPTAKKMMLDDLTVREIPRYDVSNPAGGKTIYIANEV